jgi:5-methyltetrahydrofolate--homocysteine methyltransferase
MDFLDALHGGRVLLMDGAMGTELQKLGLRDDDNAAAWNVLHPERVRGVHQAYLAAGAEVCLTNTFLINDVDSLVSTLTPPFYMEPIWEAAYQFLDGVPRPHRCASLGPVAGKRSDREFHFLSCLHSRPEIFEPADAVLLETCSTPRVRYALRTIERDAAGRPLLLSLTYRRDDAGRLTTISGHTPEWFAARAKKYGVAALGVNCGRDIGMDEVIEIVRRYRNETDLPLFARPNAGTPRREGDRWVYPLTPRAMAERLPELLEAGVRMVGGCCGTTPEHIAALRPVVDAWNARRAV